MVIFMDIEYQDWTPDKEELVQKVYQKASKDLVELADATEKYNIIPEFKNIIDCLKFKRNVIALGNMCFCSKVNQLTPNLKAQQTNINPKRKLTR